MNAALSSITVRPALPERDAEALSKWLAEIGESAEVVLRFGHHAERREARKILIKSRLAALLVERIAG